MSNHTTTINYKTIKALLDEIELYRRGLTNLKERLLEIMPEKMFTYGSDLWWEKSDMEAERSIQKGKGKLYETQRN